MTALLVGRKITGAVYSDLGRASSFMALDWVQKTLREKLEFSPYPGTLNVRLETDRAIELWRAVRAEAAGIPLDPPDPAFCRARCFLVQIEGKHQGAVIFPEVKDYPADKVEVIAPVRLKDELRLTDGKRITLEFKD